MENQWSDQDADKLSGLDLVVYASRLIGDNTNLVLWGGGNSSIKSIEIDHMGRETRTLWIKGSGSDMRTIAPHNFTPLRLDELLPLQTREAMSDEEMVAYQLKCVLDPKAPKPSIETLLHAFLPADHIYHTHADAICAMTDTPDSRKLITAIFGKRVALVDYIRPGFELSKSVAEIYKKDPTIEAIFLDKHGLITWGDSAKAAYAQTIRMVSEAEAYAKMQMDKGPVLGEIETEALPLDERRAIAAEILPLLRGALKGNKPIIIRYEDDKTLLDFIGKEEAKELTQIGPFTPDHMLRTRPWPLFVETERPDNAKRLGQDIQAACETYRQRSHDFFKTYAPEGMIEIDPNPKIILIPGIGMFTTGKDWKACSIVHDLYMHTFPVLEAATAMGGYESVSKEHICDFDYWPMENFKLTLQPAEKEFSRKIVLITGAAGAIGKAIAASFIAKGASVILTDIDEEKTKILADALNTRSGGQNAIAIGMDVSDPKSVAQAFQEAVLAFGGLDIFISNAGIARTASIESLTLADWEASIAVNATGHLLSSQAALKILKQQGFGGAVVVVTTKNVLAPGKDFGAYSASKAAQTQLAKIMAIENAPEGIRVNMVTPDGIFEGSGLWSEKVRSERAQAHKISLEDVEAFYAKRNLLQQPILASDVAEGVLFLASERSSKTTGTLLPIDGGLRDAFPR